MAQKKKATKRPANDKTFYFSVEGETEQWYLEHLKKLVNDELKRKAANFRISMVIRIEKDPSKIPWPFITRGVRTEVVHICDYEKPMPQQAGMDRLKHFKTMLSNMSAAAEKNLTYSLGYSNLSFELWMILHKQDCNGSKIDCKQYLPDLNAAYSSLFLSTKDYKKENNFKALLQGIALPDVLEATKRATVIQKANQQNYAAQNHCNYAFYVNNPSLSIHERILEIFEFCKNKGFPVVPDI